MALPFRLSRPIEFAFEGEAALVIAAAAIDRTDARITLAS